MKGDAVIGRINSAFSCTQVNVLLATGIGEGNPEDFVGVFRPSSKPSPLFFFDYSEELRKAL